MNEVRSGVARRPRRSETGAQIRRGDMTRAAAIGGCRAIIATNFGNVQARPSACAGSRRNRRRMPNADLARPMWSSGGAGFQQLRYIRGAVNVVGAARTVAEVFCRYHYASSALARTTRDRSSRSNRFKDRRPVRLGPDSTAARTREPASPSRFETSRSPTPERARGEHGAAAAASDNRWNGRDGDKTTMGREAS